jgi:hypothetical protein
MLVGIGAKLDEDKSGSRKTGSTFHRDVGAADAANSDNDLASDAVAGDL